MNPLKKGPEIKMPRLKVPDFLVDLYYDLHDRHLLPLAGLLIVALIAVPFLLGGGADGEGGEAGSGGDGGASASSAGFDRSGALVAEVHPGLRDYRRRLDDLEAKDPFRQQFEEAEEGAGEGGEEASAGGSTTTTEYTTESTEYSAGSTETSTGSSGKDPGNTAGELTYFSYAIDVRVLAGGSGKATVRRNLPELTMLPSRDTPAIVYMGSTRDGKKAVMTVSSDVQAIYGDAKCVLGSETCQLLAMETGVPETFVYGGAGKTYKIELLKIHLVTTDKLNKAPLGKPKQGKKK
ncbi:MAG: hypothetical protein AB7T48_01515 [Solirubrobacterales bacterium]